MSSLNPLSNWIHSEYLINFYKKFVDELGKPSYLVNKKNGIVVWDNNQKRPWSEWIIEHYLKDERVEHCVPKPHTDFFYTTIKVFVPKDKVLLVQSISGSVMLDLLKNTATARCGSTNANYATLRTVVDVLTDDYTYEEINEMYKTNIGNMAKDRTHNIEKIKKYVMENKVKELRFHPFAFEEGCGNSKETFANPPKMKKIHYKPLKSKETFADTDNVPKMKNVKYIQSSNKLNMKEINFYKNN